MPGQGVVSPHASLRSLLGLLLLDHLVLTHLARDLPTCPNIRHRNGSARGRLGRRAAPLEAASLLLKIGEKREKEGEG